MEKTRKIKKVFKSKATIEGAGVHLKRAFGYQQVPVFDPFLLLDDFHADDPARYLNGFPWHPHRGIETITYVLHGKVEHGDSMGNKGTIEAGDVQWMTAGSGIIHQEMPKGEENGLLWGFQLWANLPAAHKMIDPRYQEIKSSHIPEVTLEGGARIKVICGEVKGVKGPVRNIVINPEYLDVSVPPGKSFSHRIGTGKTAFAYVVGGKGYFDREQDAYAHEVEETKFFDYKRECLFGPENLILYEDGEEVVVSTQDEPIRFLLISGKPIREPVAWHGPIVMNTKEELRIAFEEYERGTFIKHKKK